jgi:CheY-like chemotaxis protein
MKKILCIEDDPDIADVIELALGDVYDVKIVTNTKDVMETLLAFIPDLILIDNYIGMVQAADVMREIKTSSRLENIPFILCSGHVNVKNIALEISASAYLEKPFDLADLYTTIDQVFLISPAV